MIPSPVNPALHEHWKEPMVFWQLAFASQGDERHSLISMNRGKNINKMKYTILVTPFFARFVYYGLLKLARFPMKISFCEILKKQIVPCVSTGTELLFEWSHHRISAADSKVRVSLLNSIWRLIPYRNTALKLIISWKGTGKKNVPPQPPVTKLPLNICVIHPTKLKPMRYLYLSLVFILGTKCNILFLSSTD